MLVPIKNIKPNPKATSVNFKYSGIYELYIPDTKWNYIGSSFNVDKRIKQHFRLLRKGSHCNAILQNVYNKHKNLLFRVIEFCEENILLSKEQYYIDSAKPTMNICKLAGSTIGYKHSPEDLEKIKEFNRQLPKKESWRNGVKKTWFKKGCTHTFTSDQIQKRVASFKGYKHSEDARLKMSEIAKNRDISKIDLSKFNKAGVDASKKPVAKYKDGVLIEKYESITEALAQFKTKQPRHLSDCLKGKKSTYKKFEWKYI
jgi:group I intron endonuclease